MSAASTWLESAALNHFFRNTPTTPPQQPFLGLFISDPTDGNIGVEVSDDDYARQSAIFSAPYKKENGYMYITNIEDIHFPVASVNQGVISHFGVFTAATGGELMVHGAVPIPREIMAGDEAVYREGSLEIMIN